MRSRYVDTVVQEWDDSALQCCWGSGYWDRVGVRVDLALLIEESMSFICPQGHTMHHAKQNRAASLAGPELAKCNHVYDLASLYDFH